MKQAYGVLGFPLGHSLSPYLHNHAFEKYGMQRCYFKWEVDAGNLPDFMKAVRILPLAGVSVTIPHKEGVMEYLDEICPDASSMGAVNTIYWKDDKLVGTNTDWTGFMAPIKNMNLNSALVLGVGGASRSVVYGLQKHGLAQITLCSRNPEKSSKLAQEFNVDWSAWESRGNVSADILINATPVGTRGPLEKTSAWEFETLPFRVVYDLVYNPLKTVLIQKAQNQGLTAVSGLTMFVFQALEQFRLWTGESFDPARAEALLRTKLSSE